MAGGRVFDGTGAPVREMTVVIERNKITRIVAPGGRAVARHDTWLVQFPQLERYDRLRKDSRAARLLAALGTS